MKTQKTMVRFIGLIHMPIDLQASALIHNVKVTIQKKRGDPYLLLVPLLEAFALPDDVERATRNPR